MKLWEVLLWIWNACCEKLHVQFDTVHTVYIKHVRIILSILSIILRERRKCPWWIAASHVMSLLQPTQTHIQHIHEPRLLRYKPHDNLMKSRTTMNPKPREVKRSSEVNQEAEVYLSLLEPFRCCPSKSEAYLGAHIWARTVDIAKSTSNPACCTEKA
jgi:hypothetical protein